MSFITNVNTLVQYLGLLEKTVKLLDPEALAALAKTKPELLQLLADDLSKGTNHGKRKLDIDLVKNAKDPVTEVSYHKLAIALENGHVFSATFTLSTSTNIPSGLDASTDSVSYIKLKAELEAAIKANNTLHATDKSKQVLNTYIDIVGATTGAADHRVLRVLDVGDSASNINAIQLETASVSDADAVDTNPTYTWIDTTSSMQLLVDHLPEFIEHTEIWQQIHNSNPLPNGGIGFLGKDSGGVLNWLTGAFFKNLNKLDVTKDYASEGIVIADDVKLGTIAEVKVTGTPHADWGIAHDVFVGDILFVDSQNHWRVLDDAFNPRAIMDTTLFPNPPKKGLLGYDVDQQRLTISLPTADPTKYAWVDASPALKAGDLSAILAPDGAIAMGALNTQAATPKQINQFVTSYAGRKADLNAASAAIVKIQTDMAAMPTSTVLTNMQAAATAAGLVQTDLVKYSLDIRGVNAPVNHGRSMTGPLMLATKTGFLGQEAITAKFAEDTYLPLKGGVLTGAVQTAIAPLADNELTNKKYVDGVIKALKKITLVLDGTHTMTDELLLSSDAMPSVDKAATPKGYVVAELKKQIPRVGGVTVTGELSFNNNPYLTHLGKPVNAKDAANKEYVDTSLDEKVILVSTAVFKGNPASREVEAARLSRLPANANKIVFWD